MQMLSDELQAEKTKSRATHSKYVATQAQVEYVNNLLREANAKIEHFENQRKATELEFPSPARLQQRLLEITRERLQLQEDPKKLQGDYLLATQNLQSSTDEANAANERFQEVDRLNADLVTKIKSLSDPSWFHWMSTI